MRSRSTAWLGLCAALGGLMLAIPTPVQAKALKFFTVEVTPWADFDKKTGAHSGLFNDLVLEFERRSGHQIQQLYMPFARLERELETGSADCGIFIWSDSRAKIAEKGEIIYQFPVGVIARKGVSFKTYEDLHKLTVSVIRGLSLNPQFDNDTKIKKDVMTDYSNGLQELSHKRVDAIMGALWTIHFTARKEGVADHLGDEMALSAEPLALQCSRKSPNASVLGEFNQMIRDMMADGTTRRIFEKHYVGITPPP